MKPFEVGLVKFFCGILHSNEEILEQAKKLLIEKYGDIDYISESFSFAVSDYYQPEMGWPIYRLFYSFEKLINPKDIAKIKIECNSIEDQLAIEDKRKVNIDPGYLDYDKMVLASAKYNGQKIYLDYGIYADLTLRYEKGNFYPYPWSFPDFKEERYNKTFLRIRENFKLQRKKK